MTTPKTDYQARVAAYWQDGMTSRDAERAAIMDLYGDEIRAEEKVRRARLRAIAEGNEFDGEEDAP